MMKFTVINKKVGETPLQALQTLRRGDTRLAGLPLTYAGRLDPMAEGKLLVLIGEECKKRKMYDGLDKEYEFEVLFGTKSDTGDVLGLADACGGPKSFSESELQNAAHFLLGSRHIPYPAFSSKTVQGKPMFQHALENTLDEIDIPTNHITIHRIQLSGVRSIRSEELFKNILAKISLLTTDPADMRVGSDFRIDDIRARWQKLQKDSQTEYVVATYRAIVSSGAYVRTLSSLIAEKLGTCGLAYSIKRTKMGRYVSFTRRFGFWRKSF